MKTDVRATLTHELRFGDGRLIIFDCTKNPSNQPCYS